MSAAEGHDPLASAREMREQMRDWKAEAVANAKADTEKAAAPAVSASMMTEADAELAAGLAASAFTVKVHPGVKHPIGYGWNHKPGLTPEAARAHVAGGGNVGIDPGRSRMVVMDAENQAGVDWLLAMGFQITVTPAKSGAGAVLATGESNGKEGGGHVWIRLPEGAPEELGDTRSMIHLKDGGKLEIFASRGERQVVAPPSRLDEAYGLSYAFTGADIAEAPAWLWDRAVPVPETMDEYDAAQVHGAVAPPTPREKAERSAESQELSDRIREIPWSEWIAGDPRIEVLDTTGSCGCNHFHFVGQSSPNAGFLHECDDHDGKAHLFSTTAMAELGLEWAHVSRLDFALGLRNSAKDHIGEPITRGQLMREFDLITTEEREQPQGTRPADFVAIADYLDRLGQTERAQRFRASAARMQAEREARAARQDGGETFLSEPMIGTESDGANALAPDNVVQLRAAPAPVIGGLPVVDPRMAEYRQRAAEEVAGAPPTIDTNAGRAHGLLPADTRSLDAAIAGPRATPKPVDVEATDGQLAQAVAAAIGGTKLRYAYDSETWYAWDGNRFAIDAEAARGAVQGLLQRQGQATDPAARQRKIRAWTWKKLTAEQKLRASKEWEGYSIELGTGDLVGPGGVRIEQVAVEAAAKAEETRTRNAVVAQLAASPLIKTRTLDLDAHPEVLATPGGYLHLGDREVVKSTGVVPENPVVVTTPDPAMVATKLMGARYDDAAACPRWDQALADALPNRAVRRWLQKTLGAALFGRQDNHMLLVFEGLGGNGKGLVVEVLTAIFGDYAATLQASVLTLAGMNNHATDLMPLKGARFATADEVPPQQLYVDRIKKITGGGTLPARGIAKDQIEWMQSHLLCLMTNNRLQWPPTAMQAMRRRLRVIRFDVEFGAPGGPAMVGGLATAIIREEASGVLNWLLEGFRMYLAEGLDDVPAEIDEWTQATLAASSSWAGFCDLAFEVTKDHADVLLSADIFPLWDFFRGQDTDQKHASPGSARVVAAMLVEQLRGVARIEAKGKIKAGVRGVRWSEDGLALLEEMQQARFVTPAFGSVTPPTFS